MAKASNQELIRHVNDIVAAGFSRGERMEILCECGRNGCTHLVPLLREDYDSIRLKRGRHVVSPEHEPRKSVRLSPEAQLA